jgi:hypothetical protein
MSPGNASRPGGAPPPRAGSARGSFALRLRRLEDRLDDRLIARAAAEVSREQILDLRSCDGAGRRCLEQVGRRDQDPGRAEAALERVMLVERPSGAG